MYNSDSFKRAITLLLLNNFLLLLLASLIFIPQMAQSFIKRIEKPPTFSIKTSYNRKPSPTRLHSTTLSQIILKSLATKYGPVMLLQLGSKPVLVISSARASKEVLRTYDLTFSSRPKPSFAEKLLYNYRNVAFVPNGEYWRQIRSICVLQLLSNNRVQSFKGAREEEVAIMLETIQEYCLSSSDIHTSKILAMLTNNIVSRVAIGKRYSSEKGEQN